MRISLCIVVRNESAFLRDCIESARPIVDEVVVVDTGSTDGTPELARRAGARVIRAGWPGDLGQAHDLPLGHARGDWILSLDADEVLDPRSAPAVRELAASGECDGYRFPIRNYAYYPMLKWRPADARDPLARGALGYIPTSPVRLFRHGKGYHYKGFLHQAVAPSILAAGGRVGAAQGLIHHYGFLRMDRAKSSLYIALARRQVTADPGSPQGWIELGIALLLGRDHPAALDAFRRARGLARSPAASFGMGEALLEMAQPAAALPYLFEGVQANARDEAPEFDRADAWERIGRAYEMLGRRRAAASAYRQALAIRPESPVALNDLAGLLAERGATRQAEALLQRLLGRYPGLAMPRATLGTLRLRQGDLAGARRALQTALDIDPLSAPARINLGVCRALASRRHAAGDDPPTPDIGSRKRPGIRDLALRPLGGGAVVSLINHLAGGGGRVLVDVARALRGRPQLVLCVHTDAHTNQGLRAELARARVPVRAVASERVLRAVLHQVRPEVVIHHWWENRIVPAAARVGGERWIAVGHGGQPMPLGYDAYVVLSEFHARVQGHLPVGRVHRIPNGVDVGRFGPRPRPGRRPVTIAMLSRLDPGKFPRRLLEYLPCLDALGARLLIAGRGGRRYEIEPEIARRGLDHVVRFAGPIPSDRVPEFLRQADIGLHLTETHEERCSVAILEMLAAGLPIVAEPKGCLPEMVIPDVNGFLDLEEKQIAAHLERLILSPGLRRRLGAASRRRARRWDMPRFRFAWRKLVGNLDAGGTPCAGRPTAHGTNLPFQLASSERSCRGPVRRVDGGTTPGPQLPPWRPSLSILVCCTPRSGGGLLCEALANTGVAGDPDDFFVPEMARSLAPRWGATDFSCYLGRALEEGATPNGVFAARLTWEGLQALLWALDRRTARPPAGAAGWTLNDAFPGLRFVWISRRDRVRQAISWVQAVQTGCWSWLKEDEALPVRRPRFDATQIARRVRQIQDLERRWEGFFQAGGIAPVRVFYEDLARHYEGTARGVARRLGIHLPRNLFFGERRMLPMAGATSEDWARRFRSVQPPAARVPAIPRLTEAPDPGPAAGRRLG